MMVKDEEKNLRRCFESLKLLIDKPYVELIIVDTGSKDSTVDIAKEYTEKLYFHPWNNSFADMRNITISYAKGEWIFIMDADEELKNPQELLDLINDNRIDKFNTIMLREKEAQKVSIPGHTINAELFNTSRLFKNDGEFRYVGNVHNQPVSKEPVFLAQNILLHHYGYDISDKELMDKKFKRTSELLKSEIEKEPNNVYYRYQLSVSYSMHGDKKEAWNEIKKAYALIIDKNDKTKISCSYIYNKYAVFGYAQGKYQEIIDVCNEGIRVRPDYVDLYFFAAQAMENIEDNEGAIEYYKKYLDLMDKFDKSTFVSDFSVVLHTAVIESQTYACEKIATHYINNEDYIEAIKYASLIKEENDVLINLFIKIYLKFHKYEELKSYYLTIKDDKKDYFIFLLEENKKKLDKEEIENIQFSFSKLEDNYGLLNSIRIDICSNDYLLDYNNEEKIRLLNFNLLPQYYGDIIYQLLKIKHPVYDILKACYELKLNKYFEYLWNKYEDLSEVILNYLNNNKESANFTEIRINKALERYVIALNKLDDKQFADVFKRYVKDGINYISEVYNEKIIEEERIYDLKSYEEAFFIYLSKAEELKDSNEIEYTRYLSKALNIFPEMKLGIEILLSELQEKQGIVDDEMEKLKLELKYNIKNLIETGNINLAENLIKEYESIVNNDVEIVLFKSQIAVEKLKLNNKGKLKM